MLELLQADDLTPVQDLQITALEAGQDSDAVEVHLWSSKGDPLAQTFDNVMLSLQTEDPSAPGTYLSTGLPPQDERWGRVRVIGYDNTGDPSWSVPLTVDQSWGAFKPLVIGAMPADVAVHLEIRMHPPSTAQQTSYRWAVVPMYGEYSRPAPPLLDQLHRGVLSGNGDPTQAHVIEDCALTPSAIADDQVHVSPGLWLASGRPYGKITTAHQLDQVDGDTAALVAGNAYVAMVSLGAGVTVTKGVQDVVPVAPIVPAGEVVLGTVEVAFDAGGTSVVEAADVTPSTAARGRYAATPGNGLELLVAPGQALGGGTWRVRTGQASAPMPDNSTAFVWQTANGNFDVTTDDIPPSDSSLGPLWRVETAAGLITSTADLRPWAGRAVVLRMSGPVSLGTVDDLLVEHPELHLERVTLRVSDNGQGQGATSGATMADLFINDTTAFTDHATEDLRPSIAFDAAELVAGGTHQAAVLRSGDVVAFDVVEVPTGGAPIRAELTLFARIP